MSWREQAATSHYQTAVAIREELQAGNITEAAAGIEELIDALSRSEKRALKSHLVRLMAHIIKWQAQPEMRNRGWQATIYNARDEIADIREETPSLNREAILAMWDKCVQTAKRQAEGEMNHLTSIVSLTWDEVFTQAYAIES